MSTNASPGQPGAEHDAWAPDSFGRWMKDQRKAAHLTQQALAQQVGCALITVKRLETDTLRPSQAMAERILQVLQAPPVDQPALLALARAPLPTQALRNPYKGLRAFGEADATDFFGRTALVQRLLSSLAAEDAGRPARFLAVVGPSGSGKSSVVRAGLIPALRSGAMAGSDRWLVSEMRPGSDPLTELTAALLRVAPHPSPDVPAQVTSGAEGLHQAIHAVLPTDPAVELLLLIDQFEELFTLVKDEPARRHLLLLLTTAICAPSSRLRLVITLRADFYDRPLAYEGFGALMQHATEVVLPLTSAELAQAIVMPARQVGVQFEPGLLAAITQDVAGQPGTLPLLQYTLTELFEQRTDNTLTLRAYQEQGGVSGTLARRADSLYTTLTPDQQVVARHVLLHLVTPGEGTDDTRRRVARADLDQVGGEDTAVATVLELFGNARLLTFDLDPATHTPTLEVAHEALIASWPRLRDWLEQSRADLHRYRRLASAAAEWRASGCDDSFLASGERLAQFELLSQTANGMLSAGERAYLEASLHAREQHMVAEQARQQRELTLARQAATRLRWLVGGLLLFLLVALGLSLFAFAQQQAAETSAAIAQGQALTSAAQAALAEDNLEQARTLALAALQAAHPAPDAEVTLARAAYAPGTRRIFNGHTATVTGAAFSPDGRLLLSGSSDRTLRLWNVATGQELRRFTGHSAAISSVTFSPDGQYALSGSHDTTLRLWNVASGQELRRFIGHTGEVHTVAFSPDGDTVLSGAGDATIRLWNVASGDEVRQFAGHTDQVWSVAFSRDGGTVLSGSGDATIRLWNVATGQELRQFVGHTDWVEAVAMSPDGRLVVSGSRDQTIRLWNSKTGQQLHQLTPDDGTVKSVAFSPDGQTIASVESLSIRFWDVATGQEQQHFRGHADLVFRAVFSPDGQHIVSGARDNTLRLWDVSNGALQRVFSGSEGWVRGVAFSPDGRTAVSGSWDWTLSLWEVASGRQLRRFEGHTDGVESVAVSPDGRFILSGSADATMRLWNVQTGAEVERFAGHTSYVWSVAFSPDGQYVLSGSHDTTARLWERATGRELRRFTAHTGEVTSVAFSPNGQLALTGSVDGTIRLWEVATGRELQQFVGHTGNVNEVVFSPDGQYVLSGSSDGTVRLWDVQSGQDLRRFATQSSAVLAVAFSPDGRTVLFQSGLSALALWDVASGREIRRFDGAALPIFSAAFSPDGQAVLVGGAEPTPRLWRVDTLPALLAWLPENRSLPALTCEQRARYQVKPLCSVIN